jgi:hypothetical protein
LNPPFRVTSLDHLVGTGKQSRGDFEAERLGGRQIDNEVELGRLLDWNVGRLCPRRILSTKSAARRNWLARFGP